MLETERIILRPWLESDAYDLYEYASDERVGPSAGWPVHTSVENSKEIIKHVLSNKETYAIVLKENMKTVGSVGLMFKDKSNIEMGENEAEIGYWIGVPYWGKGLVPEACEMLIAYGFETLDLNKIWCGYFDENHKSLRVQEKIGFEYQYTLENVKWELIDAVKTEHITCLTKEKWLQKKENSVKI